MRFAQPVVLWLLVLLPGIALLWQYGYKRRMAFLQALGDLDLLRQMPSRFPRLQQRWVIIPLVLLPFLCIILALGDPRLPHGEVRLRQGTLDVVVLLDVSKSMAAEDYGKHSRLAKALEFVKQLLPQLEGNQVGLVTYAGASFRQADLTDDFDALKFILDHWITVEAVAVGGSNLAQAIETGLEIFPTESTREKLMLVLSDGGNTSDSLQAAMTKAGQLGVRMVTLGVGHERPSRIPLYDPERRFKGYLEHDGQVVMTKLNAEVLKQIADGTDGSYIPIARSAVLPNIITQSGVVHAGLLHQNELKLYQAFLLAGLLAFGTQVLLKRL